MKKKNPKNGEGGLVMKTNVLRFYRILLIVLLSILAVMFCLYMFFLAPRLTLQSENSSVTNEDRKYHIVIVGRSQNESVLNDIYTGAEEISSDYDCVVELRITKSSIDKESIQSGLDYASFTNADGVIAFMDEMDHAVEVPLNKDKETIPLVTVAQYLPSVSQISYIGTNYSELGRKIAFECSTWLKGQGSIIIVNTNMENNSNYSILMSSLINSLGIWRNIDTNVLEIASSEEINKRNGTVEKKIREVSASLIVCLTEEDSVRAAQLVNDMGKAGDLGIIGFGEGNVLEKYLENGIVTELLSIDSQKIGRAALRELFEYINYGYANSYIASDVRVRKAGSL